MIKLTQYSGPSYGQRAGEQPIWVNPQMICSMSQYNAVMERESSGAYTSERKLITSIGFAAAFAEEQLGVSVHETPEQVILEMDFWFERNSK